MLLEQRAQPTSARLLPAQPILRWAGGKKYLTPMLEQLLPKEYGRYVEPMLGGGALFFKLRPKRALLGDINPDLINFYSVLRDETQRLLNAMSRLEASSKLYYEFRKSNPRSSFSRAIRFVYLNRLCWNGLYRENLEGKFNVPIGSRLPDTMWDLDLVRFAASSLQTATLSVASFEETLSRTGPGDLVFLDPPYPRGTDEVLGFNRYSRKVFSLESHARLADWIRRLSKNRVHVMLVLSDAKEIAGLYPKSLNRTVVRSTSRISCNGATRREVKELILRNFA